MPTPVIPKPIIEFNLCQRSLSSLVYMTDFKKTDYPWCSRFLGRFPLPSWQRPSVWNLDQKIALIESIYYGFDIGSFVINDYLHQGNDLVPMSDILIDGQQRVTALLDYLSDSFKVSGFYWSQLTRQQQRTFLESSINVSYCQCFDEEKLKMVYNHLNFSGVAHLESERA